MTDSSAKANKRSISTEFILFSGVGLASAVAQYGTLLILVEALGVQPLLASGIGFVLGGIVNYMLNYRLTFRSDECHHKAVVKFTLVAIVGMFLNTTVMAAGIELLRLHYLIAQIVATGVVLMWSFVCNRLWTFR